MDDLSRRTQRIFDQEKSNIFSNDFANGKIDTIMGLATLSQHLQKGGFRPNMAIIFPSVSLTIPFLQKSPPTKPFSYNINYSTILFDSSSKARKRSSLRTESNHSQPDLASISCAMLGVENAMPRRWSSVFLLGKTMW